MDPYSLQNMTLFSKNDKKFFNKYIKMIKKISKIGIICYAGNKHYLPNFKNFDKNKIYKKYDYISITVFNDEGNKLDLKNDYMIDCYGNVINNSRYKGSGLIKGQITGDEDGRFKLKLKNGTSKKFQRHHLQLWSFYPNFDWKNFMKNKGTGKNKLAVVDHILGNHEQVHVNFLEVVNKNQNNIRMTLTNKSKENWARTGLTQSIPVIVFINKKPLVSKDNIQIIFDNPEDCSKKLFNNSRQSSIGRCLSPKNKQTQIKYNNDVYTFDRPLSYKLSQQNIEVPIYILKNKKWTEIENEIKKETWLSVNKFEIERLQKIGENAPKSISNLGRVENWVGQKTYGILDNGIRKFCGKPIHQLVYFAFAPLEDVKKFGSEGFDRICHLDGKNETYHPLVLRQNELGIKEKSNIYDTLYCGDKFTNADDLSKKFSRLKSSDITNEFRVIDNNNKLLDDNFYHITDFIEYAKTIYPTISFTYNNIWAVLNTDTSSHSNNFKFYWSHPR